MERDHLRTAGQGARGVRVQQLEADPFRCSVSCSFLETQNGTLTSLVRTTFLTVVPLFHCSTFMWVHVRALMRMCAQRATRNKPEQRNNCPFLPPEQGKQRSISQIRIGTASAEAGALRRSMQGKRAFRFGDARHGTHLRSTALAPSPACHTRSNQVSSPSRWMPQARRAARIANSSSRLPACW